MKTVVVFASFIVKEDFKKAMSIMLDKIDLDIDKSFNIESNIGTTIDVIIEDEPVVDMRLRDMKNY